MELALAAIALLLAQAADRWPQFRGEGASGIVKGPELAESWSATENVAWAATVPGQGWSSPVVWGNRIFLTSLVGDDAVVAPKTGYYGPRETLTPPGERRWTVFCLDAETGKIVWEKVVHRGKPEHTIHVKSSYAAETPVTDGERVYALFGNVGVFCIDFEGKELWSKRWKALPTRLGWGNGSSPALHGERLFVLNDTEAESWLAAFDRKSGAELWRVARDEKTSWATPFVWENGSRTELVTVATKRVRSYDLEGKLLWELGGMSPICIPTPVAAHGLLFVDSGYEFGRPRPLLAVRPGASGDISLKEGETSNAFVAWHREPAGCYHPSPLVVGDRLYVLYSTGFLGCFDARTGKELYPRGRLEGTFTASPWASGGRIFCLNEQGETFVLADGPEFKLLRRNAVGEMAMATPAAANGRLYLRTLTRLYCILRKP